MDDKAIQQLMKQFDQSSLKELHLVDKDFKLELSKRNEATPVSAVASQIAAPAVAAPTVTSSEPVATLPTAAPVASEPDELAEIKAPLVGVVYFAPSPDRPVFKKVGDSVKKGEVVCVIEAMKMINDVKSPIDGVIKKVLVKDGSMVEFDEPIFKVEAK